MDLQNKLERVKRKREREREREKVKFPILEIGKPPSLIQSFFPFWAFISDKTGFTSWACIF